MRFWTAHLRPGTPPRLVGEGFSGGAFLFGPFWLAAHRAWIPAVLDLVAAALIATLTSDGAWTVLTVALAVVQGLFGRDWVRWSLERRGYVLAHVVAARDAELALDRLLQGRPDLVRAFHPVDGVR